MRRLAPLFGCASMLAACLCGSRPPAAELPRDEARKTLTSISKREKYVFASTADSLFRAPLATKRWEKLKIPPHMPPDGKFAAQPGNSSVVIYVATKSQLPNQGPRPGSRYGLYLSRDDGLTWELGSERNDFGAALLHSSGALFAVTGCDGINTGDRVLRSVDMGKTWRNITHGAQAQLMSLEPDPDHPGLVRIHGWAIRGLLFTADDENYRWRVSHEWERAPGRRPSEEFFARGGSSSTTFYMYEATLSNYFRHDFGNQTSVHALEVVPLKTRFEFARGAPVVVPIRVVFLSDEEHADPKATGPIVKLADQPDSTAFWGLRVESTREQIAKYPSGRDVVTMTIETTPDGKTTTRTSQPPRIPYEVFNLSPSTPYKRYLDLGRLHDFSKPGEYRVQVLYSSGGHPDREKDEWDGSFDSPVFTVVVQKSPDPGEGTSGPDRLAFPRRSAWRSRRGRPSLGAVRSRSLASLAPGDPDHARARKRDVARKPGRS